MSDSKRSVPNLTNIQCALFLTYVAGGAERPVDTEDIAINANLYFPGRFSWQKHANQINLMPIQKRLYDARSAKYGSLVSGSDKKGWILTPSGLKWIQDNSDIIELIKSTPQQEDRVRTTSGIRGTRHRAEIKRIYSSIAYDLYKNNHVDKITKQDAKHIFRIDEYVNPQQSIARVTRALNLFAGDDDIEPFLKQMALIIEKNGE